MSFNNLGIIALIPCRSGSKRIPDKNIKDFFGHPLIGYTIRAALRSMIFDEIYVSSDSQEYLDIAEKYGATPILRPKEYALDTSTDYDWVKHAIGKIEKKPDIFAVLRPTNPFRMPSTIRRAYGTFLESGYPSLRAVERCRQHPHKMWRWLEDKSAMCPILSTYGYFHNLSTQSLCEVYAQNGSMDMSRIEVLDIPCNEIYPIFNGGKPSKLEIKGNITGNRIFPFFTEGYEGYDLNSLEDWILAEELVKRGLAKLPEINL